MLSGECGGLPSGEPVKFQLQIKTAQNGGIELIHQIGGNYQQAVELLYLRQHFIDHTALPTAFRPLPGKEKRIRLINNQCLAKRIGAAKSGGNIFLRTAHIFVQQIRTLAQRHR